MRLTTSANLGNVNNYVARELWKHRYKASMQLQVAEEQCEMLIKDFRESFKNFYIKFIGQTVKGAGKQSRYRFGEATHWGKFLRVAPERLSLVPI